MCGLLKPQEAFYADRSKASGVSTRCKECCDARPRVKKRNPYVRRVGPPRKCRKCGNPALSQRHHYCGPCGHLAAAKRAAKRWPTRVHTQTTTERGYGAAHKKLRKRWEPRVERGEVCCARCGGLIQPGSPWDLGHSDVDRSQYTGPEHARCNRATWSRQRRRARARPRAEAWL